MESKACPADAQPCPGLEAPVGLPCCSARSRGRELNRAGTWDTDPRCVAQVLGFSGPQAAGLMSVRVTASSGA